MKNLIYCYSIVLLAACNTGTQPQQPADSVIVKPLAPEKREQVKASPVAEYKQHVEDELNEWYFIVRLYETPATFRYKVAIQYKELRAEDTITIPNLGMMPEVQLKKGSDANTCIIGFLDKEGLFREYKQVTAKNDKVKITTIGHYTVTPVIRTQ